MDDAYRTKGVLRGRDRECVVLDHVLEDGGFALGEAVILFLRGELGKHVEDAAGDARVHG